MSRLLILMLSMGLIACQQQSDTAADAATEVHSAEVAASADAAGPKLYVFDCGRIRLVSIEAFNLKETDTDVRELSAPCYVVDHPKGQLLWDAGLPSVFAQTDGWVTQEDGVANWLEETLASQMVRMDLGFDMSSLEYVAFSHIHWDHVGASNDVASGSWLVQQGDYDAAHAEGNMSVPAVQADLLTAIKTRPTQVLSVTATYSVTARYASLQPRATPPDTKCCLWISRRPAPWCYQSVPLSVQPGESSSAAV